MNPKFKKPAKILGISAGVLVLGVVGFYGAALVKADPARYQQELLGAIKAQTGLEATAEGAPSFSLLPSPKLEIYKLSLKGDALAPAFSVERLEVAIAPLSIFSQQAVVSHVNVVQPVLTLARSEDKALQWGWLNAGILKNSQSAHMATVNVYEGVINYPGDAGNIRVEHMQAYGAAGAQFALKGTAQQAGKTYTFALGSSQAEPFLLRVAANEKNAVQFRSDVNLAAGAALAGSFSVETDDIQQWLPEIPKSQTVAANKQDAAQKPAAAAPLPVSVAGKWTVDAGVVGLREVAFKGLNSEGAGNVNIAWQGEKPAVNADMRFSAFDYLAWKQLLQRLLKLPDANAPKVVEAFDSPHVYIENPLARNITIQANLAADKLVAGKQEWGKASLNAALDGGAVTINQCDIALLGDGAASLFGVVSQGGKGELRFEGSVDARGKSLRQALSMIDPSAGDLPDIGFGEFSVMANLFVSTDQFRLSEANATLEGAAMSGALIGYLDEQRRMEAKVRVNNINFDYVRDSLRKKSAADRASQIWDNVLKFGWLKGLSLRLDAKVFVDGFTFMERKGDTASFSLYAYDGDFRLYDMQLKYPGNVTDISLGLNVKGGQPAVKLQLNTDAVDTSYFNMEPDALPPAEGDKAYLDKSIDMSWMDGWSGVFDVSMARLVHKGRTFSNVKMQSRLEKNQLAIQKLSFVYSQARSNVAGTLIGGRVPGMAVNFTMANADLLQLVESITGLTNITGSSSLSGTLSTSGLNWRAWLEQMDAKLLISGRGVKVQGVNIAGVSQVVGIARSSADVFNNVSKVIGQGTTEFSLDGSINIAGGQMQLPGLTLKSGLVTGKMTGVVKLLPMTMQSTATFSFANLAAENVPSLIVQMNGPLTSPDMNVDTSSLEAFVAKRMVGK